ncbi:MAG TPA: methyltransferase domain-containing protein [Gaiellaceae bacterium]|nr:methyltransferase domain-containing protein [Gaiellaceae bacterium]
MEPTEENRRAWDRLQQARIEQSDEQPGIPEPIRELLPDLTGLSVLHEQCGTGETSAELVALGALVTGIDVSQHALATARHRFPNIAFLQADPHELPVNLRRRRFDLVYAAGLLPYLHDLHPWAFEAAAALRTGGRLLVVDLHPAGACVDATTLRWRDDYFGGDLVVGHRMQPLGRLKLWRLSELVNAIAATGLVVRRLEEFPTLTQIRRQDPRVPGAFALLAQKVVEEPDQG